MSKLIFTIFLFSFPAFATDVVVIYKDGKSETYANVSVANANKFRNYNYGLPINLDFTENGVAVNESLNPTEIKKIRVID